MKSAADLPGVGASIGSTRDLTLFTAHPQGGNALGRVVGADFLLSGVSNLRVCDASVFPMSAGVNPQWTVMALARLCALAMVPRS